ncbi:MAG: CaiB/BaiF CoA transferase family protein, partial [Thermoplasmata archaeon]
MAGLLDDMRVLDLSAWRPMPHATQILADLGAEVLKVEPPGGDPMRAYPEIFASVARGKRSIVLDLGTHAGRSRARELAAQAGVVCESWRPGVADRLGVGYREVAPSNPAVIYCSLSGYGQEGPLRSSPGHDLNFQALAGAVAPRHEDEHDPETPRLPVADLEGGTVCALLICAAWARRVVSNTGQRIDVAMADVVAWWVGTRSGTTHEGSDTPTFGSPGYGVFRTLDDQWIALGVLSEQRLWDATCRALGLDDLAGLDFGVRLARTEELNSMLGTEIARIDRDSALARFEAVGAPATAVLRPEEATRHPHFLARDIHVRTDAGLVAALPASLAGDGRTVSG